MKDIWTLKKTIYNMETKEQTTVSSDNFFHLYGEVETAEALNEWCRLQPIERASAINNIAKFLASRSKIDPKLTAAKYLKQKRYLDFEKEDL